jgi:integrase
LKALRSTAICGALLAGRDVVFVAKNAGTSSVDIISRYYTKHLSAEMSVRESHPIEIDGAEGRE